MLPLYIRENAPKRKAACLRSHGLSGLSPQHTRTPGQALLPTGGEGGGLSLNPSISPGDQVSLASLITLFLEIKGHTSRLAPLLSQVSRKEALGPPGQAVDSADSQDKGE